MLKIIFFLFTKTEKLTPELVLPPEEILKHLPLLHTIKTGRKFNFVDWPRTRVIGVVPFIAQAQTAKAKSLQGNRTYCTHLSTPSSRKLIYQCHKSWTFFFLLSAYINLSAMRLKKKNPTHN